MPIHPVPSIDGKPCSRKVATSGRSGERAAPEVAMMRILPARWSCTRADREAEKMRQASWRRRPEVRLRRINSHPRNQFGDVLRRMIRSDGITELIRRDLRYGCEIFRRVVRELPVDKRRDQREQPEREQETTANGIDHRFAARATTLLYFARRGAATAARSPHAADFRSSRYCCLRRRRCAAGLADCFRARVDRRGRRDRDGRDRNVGGDAALGERRCAPARARTAQVTTLPTGEDSAGGRASDRDLYGRVPDELPADGSSPLGSARPP